MKRGWPLGDSEEARMDPYVGVDVSKARLDIAARPGGEAWGLPNDEEGVEELLGRLGVMRPSLVVLEASGGYERAVAAALAGSGLPMVVVNPTRACNFAKATGKQAKTDSLDAQALAHFAEAVRPEVRLVPDERARGFAAIIARRRQVVGMLVAVSTVRERLEAHVGFLEAELDELDRDLDRAIRQSPVWREKDELVRSVPGVGRRCRPPCSPSSPSSAPSTTRSWRRWWGSPL